MTFHSKRPFLLAAKGLLSLIALACSSGASDPVAVPTIDAQSTASADASLTTIPTPFSTSTPNAHSSVTTPTPPTTAATGEPTTKPYNPTATMYEVFSEFGLSFPTTSAALEDILREKDTSQVPVLIEAIRFMFDVDTREEVAAALRELTGQDFDRREWDEQMEWLGKNRDEFHPPEGYVKWKIALLSELDAGYVDLLGSAEETSRIDPTELVWGGVIIDGIPDLRDPNIIPSDQADYLGPDERVFGVSINGEHRAYPLRITNPHEMVNDVLGGEPIALAW